jgi:hypothetical protein
VQLSKTITVIAVLLLTAGAGWAQRGKRGGGQPPPPPPPSRPAPQAPNRFELPREQRQPERRPPATRGPGPHFGDWLRNREKMSPQERMRALEQDRGFRNQPPEVQQRMRNRLEEFNKRSPEEQQRILRRMEMFEHLTPEQQQKVRSMFRDFRDLPAERRRALDQGLRFLQDMPADQRQKALDSDAFRNRFSDQERDLLRGMSGLGIAPGGTQPSNPPPPE